MVFFQEICCQPKLHPQPHRTWCRHRDQTATPDFLRGGVGCGVNAPKNPGWYAPEIWQLASEKWWFEDCFPLKRVPFQGQQSTQCFCWRLVLRLSIFWELGGESGTITTIWGNLQLAMNARDKMCRGNFIMRRNTASAWTETAKALLDPMKW